MRSVLHVAAGLLAGSFALLGASRGSRAAPEPGLVLAGRVDAVVAAGDGVAALRDGEVVLLDGAGRFVGACRGAGAVLGASRPPDRTALPAEEVLGEAGLSDEDVSPEAEELLDDEGLDRGPRRRVTVAAGAPRALALAGTPAAVWIATADGLWRLDAGGGPCAPSGLGGREISLVAARGASVVAVADATVWRSRDAGATYEVAGVLTSRANALALGSDGETAVVADEDGAVEVDAERTVRRVLEGRVDDLTTCGGEVVALAGDGIHRFDVDGDERPAGPRPPARALACAAEGLVAAGAGVWTSADGAAWREERVGLGRSFAGVAFASGRVWLASSRGLEVVDASEPRPLPGEPPPRPEPAPWRRRPPAWAGLLPRVALAFDGWRESTGVSGVAGWRLWVLVTVTLGRRWQRTETENVEDLR
jgi:hypothetical protein